MSRLIGVFTLFQVESIDSAFTELTSHVTKTNKDVEELNNTMLRKVKKGFIIAVCFENVNIFFPVKRVIYHNELGFLTHFLPIPDVLTGRPIEPPINR